MLKVKQVWYAEDKKEAGDKNYYTGLVLELEDGRMLSALSTDVIVPFEEIKKEN